MVFTFTAGSPSVALSSREAAERDWLPGLEVTFTFQVGNGLGTNQTDVLVFTARVVSMSSSTLVLDTVAPRTGIGNCISSRDPGNGSCAVSVVGELIAVDGTNTCFDPTSWNNMLCFVDGKVAGTLRSVGGIVVGGTQTRMLLRGITNPAPAAITGGVYTIRPNPNVTR